MGKGSWQRVKWSKEYKECHKKIFGCELCDNADGIRREDGIRVCKECNRRFPCKD